MLLIDNTIHKNIIEKLSAFNLQDRTYFVGGMVRDFFMNIPSNDIDIVVEKITRYEYQLLLKKFELTGKDFPVFRFNVKDKNNINVTIELAIARIERSIGAGYRDFECYTGEDVSIIDDLSRRDLSINSIAINIVTGKIIDPFNGQDDINNKILRHTSIAFKEDPLRIFRLARFKSRFIDFTIDKHTIELCKSFKYDTLNLNKERVYIECCKMFKTSSNPSVFFKTLNELNNLDIWFNEIHQMIGIKQPIKYHGKNDVFDHTMEVIDELAKFTNNPEILFAGLFHDLGKVYTPVDILPHHYGHENISSTIIDKLMFNLSTSKKTKTNVYASIKYHMKLARVSEMKHSKILKMVSSLIRLNVLDNVILIANADKSRTGGLSFADIRKIRLAFICLTEKLPVDIVNKIKQLENGDKIKQIILNYRIRRYKEILNDIS
jgi:tRNA nucleotidyltransferase (CCA-adding enzyme)